MTAADLVCPKCNEPMRSYERNRVLVDQCIGCGGIFLDRGELDQLLAAEQAYAATSQPRGGTGSDTAFYDNAGGQHGYSPGGHGKRRKSFLGELFD